MSELSPASQLASRWRAKRPSSSISAAAPQRMSGSSRGSCLARPPARSTAATFSCTASATTCSSKKPVASGDAEPAQAVGVAAVRDRGGHLEQREVADDRAAQAAVKPEHRHEVDGCQRDGGDAVDVGAVAAVEAERVHRVGEQLGVDAPRVAAAVLVGLDLHQRRLRAAAQPRQRPRVRVGLLELVGRAVDDELEELLERAVALEVLRQRGRVVGGLDRAQREVHRAAAGRHRHVAPQAGLELAARARRAARAATAPTPSARRRRAGRGSAARSRGRARAGGPRRRPARAARTAARRGRASASSEELGDGARGARGGRSRPAPLPERSASASHATRPAQAALGRDLALARRAVAGGQRDAEPLDERGEPVARRAALAGHEVGHLAVEAVPARRPAVLVDPPRLGDRQRLAGVVAGGEVASRARGRRSAIAALVRDRRLRVGHAHLDRAEHRVQAQLPPPLARVVEAAPAQRLGVGLEALAARAARPGAGAGPRCASGPRPGRCRGPRRTARWRPARPARAGRSAARCRRRARGRRRGTATCTCSPNTSWRRATAAYSAPIAS